MSHRTCTLLEHASKIVFFVIYPSACILRRAAFQESQGDGQIDGTKHFNELKSGFDMSLMQFVDSISVAIA